mmetsp:Transcript_104198/g.290271  ORF Transcript_104198/g.290271 Transcript_104198/m.290271 type:complete len:243 (+) Transcript_104198:3-731(+)
MTWQKSVRRSMQMLGPPGRNYLSAPLLRDAGLSSCVLVPPARNHVEREDGNHVGRPLWRVGDLLVVPIQRLQVVDDIHAGLEVINAAEVHLHVLLRHLARILHVIHQRAFEPHESLNTPTHDLFLLDLFLSTGPPVDVEERGTKLKRTALHDAIVGVHRVALSTMLLEKPPPLLDITIGEHEVERNVAEVAAHLPPAHVLPNRGRYERAPGWTPLERALAQRVLLGGRHRVCALPGQQGTRV